MGLNKRELRDQMREATRRELGALWPDVREYFEAENRKLVETLKMIALLKAAGKIDHLTAQSLLEGQKMVRRTLLLTVEGLTTIMIENTLNAALDSIREAVNTVLDFDLL
ncbi:MAG: hypothetical protein ACPGSM_14510 [Thiolinea sp.]